MIVVNSDALIHFLNEELKSRCSADPQSLTRYVMALLKKKRKEKQLRICLLDSLDVFLGKDTVSFVDLLLETLKSESYVNKSKPESSAVNQVARAELPLVNETKKEDLLGGVGDLFDPERNMCERRGDLSPTESAPQGSSSQGPQVPPPMMLNQRCKAYDQVGYCMAGSSCSYYHGCDAVVVDDVHDITHIFPQNKNAVIVPHDIVPPPLPPAQSFPLPPLPPEPPHPVYPPTPKLAFKQEKLQDPFPEAYNPEDPGIEIDTRAHSGYSFNTRKRELVVLPTNSTMNKERQVKRKAFDYNRLGPKPKFVKTETCSNTIQLSNVPPQLNKIVTLNSLFAKFGTITNIEIGHETSVIRFEKPSQAECAFKDARKCNFDIVYNGEKKVKTQIHTFIEKKEEPKKPLLNFQKKEKGKPHIIFNKSNPKEKALNKKLELLKKKQSLLDARIDYYKVIAEKMSASNKNKKEMQFLHDTLKTVYREILNMKTEIQNESLELRKSLSTDTTPGKKPMYSEKALLDAEMDFYHSKSLLRPSREKKDSEDKKDLLFEVNELKEKAKWLGLFEKEPSNEILERNSLSDEISLTTNSAQEEQESTEQSSDITKSNSLLLGDDEEEDEEEDSEARSWRR